MLSLDLSGNLVPVATRNAQRPPSGPAAQGLTVAALVLPILLPLAILFQRKARDEAASSEGRYVWSRSLVNRPVALYLITWGIFLVVTFVLTGILAAFGFSPV